MNKSGTKSASVSPIKTLKKSPTGITGLDQITGGGIPAGRPTLVCGGTGSGKTLLSLEFLIRGALEFKEPGVFIAFEEKAEDLSVNVASLGFDLQKMQDDRQIKVDYVHIDRSEIEETGEYDLSGLFIRLGYAIDTLGAKRIVLDTIENIFGGLSNQGALRSELRRLFQWLKDKNVTAIITGEKGEGTLTRHGLEEYVSDCVILLEHRVANQITTRLLRIVKYRGSVHGTNEYPFLIDEEGISVLPITASKLDYTVSDERISTGIPTLDTMLDGKGFFRGSSILVSGTAGTGKTSIAASFANEACKRKEKCIFFTFEESPQQVIRNMGSIGLDLSEHIRKGLLMLHASRPTLYGLEMHLVVFHKLIQKFKPAVVILDPITNLVTVGSMGEVQSILIRLVDFLQSEQITVMFTALTAHENGTEHADQGISSIVDAWILVRDIEFQGERNRGIYIMKSRGMKHSQRVREFVITDEGIRLIDVYYGPDGVLVGSAREHEQLMEGAGLALKGHEISRINQEIERRKKILEAKIIRLEMEFELAKAELNKAHTEEKLRAEIMEKVRRDVGENVEGNDTKKRSRKK